MVSGFTKSANGKETVFIYAETMLAKLQNQAGVNSNRRASIAYIKEDNATKLFTYTHKAEIDPNRTDAEAVIETLGDSAKFWATSRLKVLRVSPDQIISNGTEISGFIPCPNGQKYYNYTENNMLPIDIEVEEPKIDAKPKNLTLEPQLTLIT